MNTGATARPYCSALYLISGFWFLSPPGSGPGSAVTRIPESGAGPAFFTLINHQRYYLLRYVWELAHFFIGRFVLEKIHHHELPCSFKILRTKTNNSY